MVKLSSRELAYYFVLRKIFGEQPFNVGNAIDVLKVFGSRRVARRVLKKLAAKGFLERLDPVTYRVRDFYEALEDYLREYLAQRFYRNARSMGMDIVIRVDKVGKSVVIDGCREVGGMVEILRKVLGSVECIDTAEKKVVIGSRQG